MTLLFKISVVTLFKIAINFYVADGHSKKEWKLQKKTKKILYDLITNQKKQNIGELQQPQKPRSINRLLFKLLLVMLSGRHGRDCIKVEFITTIYLCNQYLSPLTLWVRIQPRRCVLDTTLCDQVCQWLVTGRWFSLCTLISSTSKTDRHDIIEILLKVALNTQTPPPYYLGRQ